MTKSNFVKVVILSACFYCLENTLVAQEKVLFDPSYKTAVFADPARMEKIKKASVWV